MPSRLVHDTMMIRRVRAAHTYERSAMDSEYGLPRLIPLDPQNVPPPRGVAPPPIVRSELIALEGKISGDGGLSWFDPGDPFSNRLCLILAKSGDDWTGTVYYAGLPCLVVFAGGARDGSTQFEREVPFYTEETPQELHSLFFENVVGDMPGYGSPWMEDEGWPFEHPASVMVHESKSPEYIREHRPELVEVLETGRLILGNYNLYDDLMEFSGSQGYEITEFTGIVARAMCAALTDDDPEFAEGGSAYEALRGF